MSAAIEPSKIERTARVKLDDYLTPSTPADQH